MSPVLGGLVVVLPGRALRPGGQGPRRSRGDGRDLLQARQHSRQVAVIKSLASALSIGSGAAVGREGPIIQIGAALGSAFSQAIRLSTGQKITLLSAGAGAGIAATFNTPLGGVLFALEILLPEVSNRTFLPVVIATGAATTVGGDLIGPDPAFIVPEIQFSARQVVPASKTRSPSSRSAFCAASPPGRSSACSCSWRTAFPKLPGNAYTQNIVGMALVGLMMVALTHAFGHSYVDGVGYGVIQSILDHEHDGRSGLLALLFVLKLLATTISLGCGASGGIFSPSLYLGATLGGGFAALAGRASSPRRPDRRLRRRSSAWRRWSAREPAAS